MSVDFTGWKSGDRGVMEAEFVFNTTDSSGELVVFEMRGEFYSFSTSKIKSITRIEPPIKVGDRVRQKDKDGSANVLAVVNDDAWLWDYTNGCHVVIATKHLERIA